MKKCDFFQSIQALFSEKKVKTLTVSEIAKALNLRGGARKKLDRVLRDLLVAGSIVKVGGNRYSLGKLVDLHTGTITILRSGNAFLDSPDGGESIFVSKSDLGTALPGDRVVVRLLPKVAKSPSFRPHGRSRRSRRVETTQTKDKGPSGKVVEILERVHREIVGTLKTTGKFLYVVPIHQAYKHDFYVPDDKGADINDRVLIRFSDWENKHVSPEAEIIDVLGPADNPSLDTLSIIRHYGFSPDFPADVQAEAESVSSYMKRPGQRKDMRDALIITIDPARSRDFDDALSLEVDSDGNRVLGVHIADVSHFVRHNSKLDAEAKRRGNSVYLPDMVVPMLPEQLSNGMCSLRPDEDRLAFSAFITLDSAGKMVARSFAKTIIRSSRRLTYEEAMATISGKDNSLQNKPTPEVVGLLKKLNKLAQQLRRLRFARHALDLDIAECEIVINDKGVMTGVRSVVNDASHQLVEECMVLANEVVAMEISENSMPLISRFHDKPSEEKLEELTATLLGLGYFPGDLGNRREMAKFLKSIKDNPLAYHAKIAVLRSMERAIYSSDKHGHFGLAKSFYSHFTSPIRRYPDLVLHRQLASWLSKQSSDTGRAIAGARSYGDKELSSVALLCSGTEQKAEEAERSLIEIKKYRFLADELKAKSPNTYKAVVAKTSNFGMFVEVLDLQIQGLVHISAIPGGYVKFNRKDSSLRVGKRIYKVGTELKVHVVRVDMDNRKIDFVPVV